MTPQPLQKESLEALDELYNFVDGLDPDFIIRERISIIKSRIQDTRSRPAPSAKSKALIFIPKPSTELILIAEQEWDKKQRQQHDKASWISGFLEGYFSKPVNIQQHDATIRNQTLKDEREKRIKDYEHLKTHIIETCNYHGGNWIVDQIINRINHRIESLRHTEAQHHSEVRR